MRRMHGKGGFTLVEMAIVLVIIGVILTVALPLLTEGIQRDKLVKGRQTVSSLRDEIIGWTSTHAGVLPTLSTVATFAGAQDPWGNLIGYWADKDLIQGASKDICSVTSSPNNLSLKDMSNGSTYTGIAFVIASRGPNQNLQVGYTAGTPDLVTTYPSGYAGVSDTVHTAELGSSYDLATARDEAFDDVVQYVTYDYLRTRICTPDFKDSRTHAAVTFDDMASNFNTSINSGGTGTSYANNGGAVSVSTSGKTVSLGSDTAGAVGCMWWNGQNASICGRSDTGNQDYAGLCQNGTAWKKARFVFKFTVTSTDEATDSDEERGGFVFALLGVGTNSGGVANNGGVGSGSVAPCGRGDSDQYLGYTGYYPAGTYDGSTPATEPPKWGVEVDFYPNTARAQGDPRGVNMSGAHDPISGSVVASLDGDESPNHVAVVFWGTTASIIDDNEHGAGTLGSTTQPLNPGWNSGSTPEYDEFTDENATATVHATYDGFMSNATHKASTSGTVRTNWLEDSKDHWIRIVFERVDSDSSGTWTSADKMYVHVWVADDPSAAFLNVGADLVPEEPHGSTGYDLYENSTQAPAVYNTGADWFRFGWTTASGNVSASTTILSDFAFNLDN